MVNAGIVQQMSEGLARGGFVGCEDGDGRRRSIRYKGGGGAAQKRKLEKAREHLRSKMRQRLNGPALVSSRPQKAGSSKGGNIRVHDDSKVDEISPKVKTLKRSKLELQKMNRSQDSAKQLNGNYWRTQEDRSSNTTRTRHSQEEIPLHELVDRVLKRKEQKSNVPPLTIRAYKQPTAPFAIQQQSKIRNIVGGQPTSKLRKHPKDKGPYFVVLHREDPEQPLGNICGRALQDSSLELQLNTWRPELDKNARKSELSSMDGEDRGVTNYKLQMQQASRLAKARFDYSSSSKKNRIQTYNALPPIARSQVEKDSSTDVDSSATREDVIANKNARSQSNDEILQAMKNYRRARRQPSGDDFNTILRTRNRYTAKTKLFKEELSRARALSIIDEDQSSVSSSDGKTSRCLSGRRPSQTSLRNFSAQSLNRIEEAKTPEPDDEDIRNAKAKHKVAETDRMPVTIEEDDEDSDDDSVFSQESSMSFRDSLEASLRSNSRSKPEAPLQFSSKSNPLSPIRLSSSPTNHDTDTSASSSSTTSPVFDQDSLPSMPIIPEIRKSSASSSSSLTNHDRGRSASSSSTAQVFDQDSLPSMPIIPEIRKSSASSSSSSPQITTEMQVL